MKRINKGSYTVECALVLPIVLLVIISLVWLLIYLYDKAALEKNIVHALLAADYDYSMSNNKLKQEIENRIDENLHAELIGMKEVRISVTVNKLKCTVSAEGCLNIPEGIPVLSKLCRLEMEIQKKRYSGTETVKDLRRLQKIADLLTEGMEDAVESGNQTGNEQALPYYDGEVLGLPDSNG